MECLDRLLGVTDESDQFLLRGFPDVHGCYSVKLRQLVTHAGRKTVQREPQFARKPCLCQSHQFEPGVKPVNATVAHKLLYRIVCP